MSPKPRREVTFLPASKADIGRLNDDDPDIAKLALRKVQDLQAGIVTGEPLEEMAKTGDLGDYRKLDFGPGRPPSHRIVYRVVDGDPSRLEVLEVIAIEPRADLYAYLLASSRLGRLPVESNKHFNRLHKMSSLGVRREGREAPTSITIREDSIPITAQSIHSTLAAGRATPTAGRHHGRRRSHRSRTMSSAR